MRLQDLLLQRKRQLVLTYDQMVERATAAGYPMSSGAFFRLMNEEWTNIPTTSAVLALSAVFQLHPWAIVQAAYESTPLPAPPDQPGQVSGAAGELADLIRNRDAEQQALILGMVRSVADVIDRSATPKAPTMDLQTNRAHSARIYDFFLGGKTHYEADRVAAEAIAQGNPGAKTTAVANRAFMHRAARYIAGQGVTQFLDIGTGIPTEPNLHQVVQEVNPASRIVYVDNDPIVLAHAAALMSTSREGATAYVQADARNPASFLDAPDTRATLDFGQPIAVTVVGLLHFLSDDDAVQLLQAVRARVAPGSWLAFGQATFDADDGRARRTVDVYNRSGIAISMRSADQIRSLFLEGLEVVEPGIVFAQRWRPDAPVVEDDRDVMNYGVVARIP